METLVIVTVIGLGFAYFATQNTANVIVQLADYSFNIPLYLVAIVSLLLGLFVALIISLFENISSGITIWGKENKLKQADRKIADLAKRIRQLEIENASLQTKAEEPKKESSRFYSQHHAIT